MNDSVKFETRCNCQGCNHPAMWLAWFEGCGNLYTYYCTHHAAEAIVSGVNGYPVSCIRSIHDAINKYRENNG